MTNINIQNITIRTFLIPCFLYSAMMAAGSPSQSSDSLKRKTREEEVVTADFSKRICLDGGVVIGKERSEFKLHLPVVETDADEEQWRTAITDVAKKHPDTAQLFLESCTIPKTFSNFPFTKLVKLVFNDVSVSSSGLYSLCKGNSVLQTLKIEYPQLLEDEKLRLPDVLDNFKNFHKLSLKTNALRQNVFDITCLLDKKSMLLKKLRKLTLSGFTDLTEQEITTIVQKWPSLETLSLEDGNVTELPKGFQGLSKLRKLDLSGNDKLVPETLGNIPDGVEKLNISNTNSESAPPGNFPQINSLREVDVSDNDIQDPDGSYPLEDFLRFFPKIKKVVINSVEGPILRKAMIVYSEIKKQLKKK